MTSGICQWQVATDQNPAGHNKIASTCGCQVWASQQIHSFCFGETKTFCMLNRSNLPFFVGYASYPLIFDNYIPIPEDYPPSCDCSYSHFCWAKSHTLNHLRFQFQVNSSTFFAWFNRVYICYVYIYIYYNYIIYMI